MARISNSTLLRNAARQGIVIGCIIFIGIYFPAPCNAGNALPRYAMNAGRYARDSTISVVRHYGLPHLLTAADYVANTRLGKAVVEQYNALPRVNGVQFQFIEIPESDKTPYPEELFQQYIIAAREALEKIDQHAPVFRAMVSYLKKHGDTVFGIGVYIIHTDLAPKSGRETYRKAEKIVSEMEKESMVTDFTKLMEIRGTYNNISVLCKIEELPLGKVVVERYNALRRVNGEEFEFKEIPESDKTPYPEELFQQYIIAAREALEKIDRSALLFQAMVSHLKRHADTVFGIGVYIIHTDFAPKSGMETYQRAEKIVSEMEKESMVTHFTKLMEIRGTYNNISVLCKIIKMGCVD